LAHPDTPSRRTPTLPGVDWVIFIAGILALLAVLGGALLG